MPWERVSVVQCHRPHPVRDLGSDLPIDSVQDRQVQVGDTGQRQRLPQVNPGGGNRFRGVHRDPPTRSGKRDGVDQAGLPPRPRQVSRVHQASAGPLVFDGRHQHSGTAPDRGGILGQRGVAPRRRRNTASTSSKAQLRLDAV
jgi:hypothetical protein